MRLQMVQWYEDLRAQATGQIPPATPRGLALLLRSGLPAWMAACPPIVAGPAPIKTAPSLPSASAPSLAGLSSELVGVLTDMVLGGLRRCCA